MQIDEFSHLSAVLGRSGQGLERQEMPKGVHGMRARDIANLIEEMAPPHLSYEGDKPGFVAGDPDRQVSAIGVSWRPTAGVLRDAVEMGVGMLIIHEPLYQSEKPFIVDSARLQWLPNKTRRALVERGGFAVYRAHSNLDDADPGQNTELVRLLGLTVTGKLPYGRVGRVNSTSLSDFVEWVKVQLGCPRVLVVGDLDTRVSTVAVVAGGGNALADMIELAKLEGADVMVSGDIQDSRARFAAELGLALVDAGGYYTETPGMRAFSDRLKHRLPEMRISYFDPGPPWLVR